MQPAPLTLARIDAPILHQHEEYDKRFFAISERSSQFRTYACATFLSKAAKQFNNETDIVGQLWQFHHLVPPIRWQR